MRPTEPAARRLPTGAPHWLQDIDATLPVTGQYVLHGNLRDVHLLPEDGINTARFVDTVSSLWWVLRRSGYEYLLRHDPVTGLHVVRADTLITPGTPDEGRVMTAVKRWMGSIRRSGTMAVRV